MNVRALTEAEIIRRLAKIGHTEITIDYPTYKGIGEKCRFIDSEYGEWWASPGNVLRRKSRHPKRHNAVRSKCLIIPVEEIKMRLQSRFGDLVTIDESTYAGGRAKARFIDRDYGEFWIRPTQLGQIHGHPMRGRAAIALALSNDFDDVAQRIRDVWGDEVVLLEYRGYNEKARFRHAVYGEWESVYANVVKGHSHPLAGLESQRQTMIERYGTEHPAQCEALQYKMASSSTRSVLIPHWETGVPLACTASYEYGMVLTLNEMREPFDWQIRFDLGLLDGIERVYYCDLYLPKRDLYVEIKGFFRNPLGQHKWERFHQLYPNSELWRRDQVKEFTMKSEYRLTKEFRLARQALVAQQLLS